MSTPPRRSGRTALVAVAVAGVVGGTAYALAVAWTPSPEIAPHRDAAAKRRDATPALKIRAAPARRTVAPGRTAAYRLRIRRDGRLVVPRTSARPRRAAAIRMRVVGALPPGVRASFSPAAPRRARTTLRLRTSWATPAGRYRVRLEGRGRRPLAGAQPIHRARTAVTLVVTSPRRHSLEISGRLGPLLAPGRAIPLDLRLTNPHRRTITVRRLTVRVSGVSAPEADAAHPCGPGDFVVRQMPELAGLRLRPRSTRSLRSLRVPPARWPHVVMLDRPVNQDGCKRASLGLRYTGIATGSGS